MTLDQARMDLSVEIVGQALRSTRGTSAADRTEAFRVAYAAIAQLGGPDDAWTTQVLDAAWELVRDAYPNGGPVNAIVADLATAYAAITATVPAPGGPKRSKPKKG